MRAGEAGEAELIPLSGKVDRIIVREGSAASRYIHRLAAQLPVVVIAGTPARRPPTWWRPTTCPARPPSSSTSSPATAGGAYATSAGPPDSPDAIQRRLALDRVVRASPHCQLTGSVQGALTIRSSEPAGQDCSRRFAGRRAEGHNRGRCGLQSGVLLRITTCLMAMNKLVWSGIKRQAWAGSTPALVQGWVRSGRLDR